MVPGKRGIERRSLRGGHVVLRAVRGDEPKVLGSIKLTGSVF